MNHLIMGMLCSVLAIGLAKADGIRDYTRPDYVRGTRINKSQANELTLTLVQAGRQHLQTWVRLAATIDSSGRYLSARRCSSDARLIRTGQRVRAFPPDSKSSIYRARVIRVDTHKNCITVKARLSANVQEQSHRYVMEIIVPRGPFMAIPKEAIIEEGDRQIVYVQRHPGHYVPQQIHSGLKGELYTEILHGLNESDQVVTFGSFFIDAEYKLKSTEQSGGGHAHHHH